MSRKQYGIAIAVVFVVTALKFIRCIGPSMHYPIWIAQFRKSFFYAAH